jgi:hypothetical protein
MVAGVSTRWPWVTLLAIAGNLSYLGTSMHVSGSLLPSFDDVTEIHSVTASDDHYDAIDDELAN